MERWNAANPGKQYIAIEPVRNQKYEQPRMQSNGLQGWFLSFISKDCENYQKAFEFLEWMASPEGNRICQYGIPDIHHTIVDGEPQYTDKVKAMIQSKDLRVEKELGIGVYYMALDGGIVAKSRMDCANSIQRNKIMMANKYVVDDRLLSGARPKVGTPEAALYNYIFNEILNKNMPRFVLAETEAEFEKIYNQITAQIEELEPQFMYEHIMEKYKAEYKKKIESTQTR